MRFIFKLSEEDMKSLETKYPDKNAILDAIISEAERLQRRNPEPPTQRIVTKDMDIPDKYAAILIKYAEAEGIAVSHYIKKEIIYHMI